MNQIFFPCISNSLDELKREVTCKDGASGTFDTPAARTLSFAPRLHCTVSSDLQKANWNLINNKNGVYGEQKKEKMEAFVDVNLYTQSE